MAKPVAKIAVTGEGEAQAAPDMAILTLNVLREADTAREAMTANNEAMGKVLAAMKEAGIEDRDLQTAGINIQPRYQYPDDKNGLKEPKITGYTVTNSLTVRVRDVTKVGEVLDKSVSLGVNQGGNLTFTNDNPAAVINEARKRAVADALTKARTLADAAGVGLGRVLEISEQPWRPQPVPFARAEMKMAVPQSDAAPVAAGENSYNVQVNVTFELKQ
ncbi:SIMPL domain-containing protein [Brucella endophytica]|uniref:SIMPL domain-containing protein n=2 Tax=Brucella endophytica TaxID=1963359 RepID=A0A916WGD5_9HYPH|nr:SIMPL domain-containing protein [Brucella endophytica]